MKQPIILFIDPLKPQHNTIDYGVHLAKSFNLPLLLYSVKYTPVPVYTSKDAAAVAAMERPTRQKEKGRQAMADLCWKVKKRWADTSFEYLTGFLAASIVDKSRWLLERADELKPTFIVMGKEHEYFWWNRVSSTTETEVAENAPCPVLIVPPSVSFTDIEQITYLLDEEELHSKEMSNLQWLTLFGSKFNTVLSFLYLPENERMPARKLDKAMARIQSLAVYQRQYYKQMPLDTSVEDILNFAADTPADLVAFPYWERSFFQRLFGQDDSRRLVLKSEVPMLVF